MDFIGAKAIKGGRIELRHRLQKHPNVIIITTVTPEPGGVEFLARAEVDKKLGGKLPQELPRPNLCWQLKRAPGFSSAPEPYPEFVKRCFIYCDQGAVFLDKTSRYPIPHLSLNDPYNNPPWVQMYVGVWRYRPGYNPVDWADYCHTRYTETIIGCVSRDGKYLAALGNDSALQMCQAWHDCMHNNPQWLPADAPAKKQRWRLKIYAMENDPEALRQRVYEDFPNAAKLKETRVGDREEVVLSVDNPDPDNLPTLGVWMRDRELLVSAKFPNVEGLTCDAWCYEGPLDFIDASGCGAGGIKLRHRSRVEPQVIYVTHISPEPGAIEIVQRVELDKDRGDKLPETLGGGTVCWQLKQASAFSSKPDPYPEFVKRCFIFTDKGRTFLDKTVRNKIASRSDDDPYNNPPWIQYYLPEWAGQMKEKPRSNLSPDGFIARVIGAVSRDGRYLTAMASNSSNSMAQMWHDCMHNDPAWEPVDAPSGQQMRRWKIYAMENDPDLLLKRANNDFPDLFGPGYQKEAVKDNLPVFYQKLKDRMSFPMSWLSGNYQDFPTWRAKAKAKVTELLLQAPPAVPFDPVVIAEEDRGSYIARKMVLNITGDSRVLAYMLVPKGKGPFPAVLLLHDHGAKFDIGKEKVIQAFDDSIKAVSAMEWVENYYGNHYIGDELAKRGYVCFCTDALNWSDRGGGGFSGQQALASNLLHLGMSFAGLIAHEDLRAAEFLSSRPNVDGKRVASMGLSMGGYRTWQVAALSDHIAAGVSICWMATVKGLMVPGNNQTTGSSAFTMTHPGLFNYLDYPDVASIACPKPMLFYSGYQDTLFPVPSVKDSHEKMRKIWESQGAGDKLETKIWDVKHVFNRQMQEEAFEWLDSMLKK